ncbi:unnamed protein product [Lymnaea stagnalis]|uniref:Uncharacterized protein n=1 Tax=Lymnaea stagnalis TaxID=6523 RepID=A0AAV2HCW9_LYMST
MTIMMSLSDVHGERVDERDPGLNAGFDLDCGADLDEREETRHRRKTVVEAVHRDDHDLPKVTLETATPTPLAQFVAREDNNEEEDIDSEEDEMDEGVEEETAMTQEEKTEMYEAVKSGDIDWLEDCLDKPNSDINMIWYKENLLMAAIRNGQQEMAEFLLDNGVDHTFTATVVGLRLTPKGKMLDRYELSCRQMAYDRNMLGIVEIIDIMQGQLFSFIQPTQRTPRYRRPKPPTPSDSEDSGSDGADISSNASISVDEDVDSNIGRRKHKKMKKKKEAKQGSTVKMDGKDSVDLTPHAMGPDGDSVNITSIKCDAEKAEPVKDSIKTELQSDSVQVSIKTMFQSGRKKVKDPFEYFNGLEPGKGLSQDTDSVTSKCRSQPDAHKTQTRQKPRPGSSTESAARLSVVRHLYRRFPSSHRSSLSQEEPLRWRKVSTVGSYIRESRNWHAERFPAVESTDIIEIKPSRPSSAQSQSAFSSRPSSAQSQSALSSVQSSCFLPKSILIKSRTSSLTSEKNLTFAREVPEIQDIATGSARCLEPVTVFKRKLEPNFVNSYRALDFCNIPHLKAHQTSVASSLMPGSRSNKIVNELSTEKQQIHS